MSGRRSHERFAVLSSPEGFLRVLRDVVVQSANQDHTVVVSRDPVVMGELVSLQSADGTGNGLPARVLESALIVVDGAVRHRLRLAPPGGDAELQRDIDA